MGEQHGARAGRQKRCVCMSVCVHVYDMCSGVCVCMVGVWYMHVHDVGFHMCVTCV